MNCIRSLFSSCFTNKKTFIHSSVNQNTFRAAGTFFTDGKTVLAGFQPYKVECCISGIGGGREDGETYMETSIRETIEELFDIEYVPEHIIKHVETILPPIQVFQIDSYISVVYSFEDLEILLDIMNQYTIQSRVYENFPLTISDLILHRIKNITSEVDRLVLIPLSSPSMDLQSIDKDFITDIQFYLKLNKLNKKESKSSSNVK